MNLCPSCRLQIPQEVCPHHAAGYPELWHVENRIYCDFFHRGVPIPKFVEPPAEPYFFEVVDE